MKPINSFLTIFLMAVPAYGNGQVWYFVTPLSGTGQVDVQGVPGGQTRISCTSPSTFQAQVHYTLSDGGATSWALDHYSPDAGGMLTATGVSVESQGFQSAVNIGSYPNMNGVLARDQSGHSGPGSTGPGDFVLFTFNLHTLNCSNNVFGGIGNVEFGGNDPAGGDVYEVVQLGSNTPRPGFSLGGGDPSGADPIPVIVVTPEPASALGLILLFAFSRRRAGTASKSKL